MTYDDLSEIAQAALREKFEREQKRDYIDMEPEHWSIFMDQPEVQKLWEEFQQDAWDQWMHIAWREEWRFWLEKALAAPAQNG